MYGYVRPDKRELRVREYELFRAAYCGLCETLRERYGLVSRLLVNYDMTFLAMVLFQDKTETEQRRCPVHPMRKRPCVCGGEALSAAADLSVILSWWKLRDNAADEEALRSLLSVSGALALKKAYEKAAAARPAFDENVRKCLAELSRLEEEKCASLDRTADCFARLLAFAADGDSQQRRIRRELFYHVGRFVYIIDAVDDLARDIREDSYNPLRYRFDLSEDKLSEEQLEQVRSTLNMSQRSAAAALSLREPDSWQPILENIVTIGMPQVQGLVLSGRWNKKDGGDKRPEQRSRKI